MRTDPVLCRASAFALALLVLSACGQNAKPAAEAPAAEQPAALIAIEEGWAAVTPTGASVAGGYGVIANAAAAPDRLISASSPRAARVEIHEMKMTGDVMQMRAMESVVIPAGGSLALQPGGNHFMFIDITAPFVEGESVPLTLTFENAGVVETTLPVRPRTQPSSH